MTCTLHSLKSSSPNSRCTDPKSKIDILSPPAINNVYLYYNPPCSMARWSLIVETIRHIVCNDLILKLNLIMTSIVKKKRISTFNPSRKAIVIQVKDQYFLQKVPELLPLKITTEIRKMILLQNTIKKENSI